MITFTAVALVALGYTYIGYPLILALWSRLRPLDPPSWGPYTPTVSVLIPVYNGEAYIVEKLRTIQDLEYPPNLLEVIVCSDGSEDRTVALAEEIAAADRRVRVIHSPARQGKPTALNRMARIASGEVLCLTDVRQPVVPGSLRALVQPLADPSIGCVSGNLVLRGNTGAGIYWRYENWIRRTEASLRSMLGVTGPIYALRASDMTGLPADVILDDMWIPMRLRLMGRRIVFAEAATAYDEAFGDQREFGRKVRTLAGNFQLLLLLPALLNPFRNPSFFEYLSHKILRLVCPFLLIGIFASSAIVLASRQVGTAPGWIAALFLAQTVFYALAVFPRLGGGVGRVARGFVVLNAAAIVGLVRFARGRQRITW